MVFSSSHYGMHRHFPGRAEKKTEHHTERWRGSLVAKVPFVPQATMTGRYFAWCRVVGSPLGGSVDTDGDDTDPQCRCFVARRSSVVFPTVYKKASGNYIRELNYLLLFFCLFSMTLIHFA